MFEDSTFESVGAIHTRTRIWMMATFALNGSILLALVLIPLFHPQMLPSFVRSIAMEAPPPPVEPVRLPQALQQSSIAAPQSSAPAFQAPTIIPHLRPDAGAPDNSSPIDIRNLAGIEGPSNGNAGPFGSGSNVPLVKPAPGVPAPVSQGVMNGLLVFNPKPVYPPIAIQTRTEGTVVLEAIISRTGSIENLRIVSGPAMLRQSALGAVAQWKYRPYTLNGQPVEVETTVNVVFKLN
jgi:periplasmic protein TonB